MCRAVCRSGLRHASGLYVLILKATVLTFCFFKVEKKPSRKKWKWSISLFHSRTHLIVFLSRTFLPTHTRTRTHTHTHARTRTHTHALVCTYLAESQRQPAFCENLAQVIESFRRCWFIGAFHREREQKLEKAPNSNFKPSKNKSKFCWFFPLPLILLEICSRGQKTGPTWAKVHNFKL